MCMYVCLCIYTQTYDFSVFFLHTPVTKQQYFVAKFAILYPMTIIVSFLSTKLFILYSFLPDCPYYVIITKIISY